MMAGVQPLKGKAVTPTDQDRIERLRAQTLKQRKDLKRARDQVADDKEALRVATRRKQFTETQLARSKCSADSIESQVYTQVALCSAQLLKPILHELQATLPLEVREMIYENLVNISSPKVVPKSEGSEQDVFDMWASSPAALDPFKDEPMFDLKVMGAQTSDEIRELFIRRTPLYFRGWTRAENLGALLDADVLPGKQVRDLTQHLRV